MADICYSLHSLIRIDLCLSTLSQHFASSSDFHPQAKVRIVQRVALGMYGVTRFLSRRVTTPSDAAIGALGTVAAGVTTALTAKMVDGLYKKTNHEVAHAFTTTPGAHVRPGWSSSSIHQRETYLSKMRLETVADRYTLVPKDDILEVLTVLAECHNLTESFTKKLKLFLARGKVSWDTAFSASTMGS